MIYGNIIIKFMISVKKASSCALQALKAVPAELNAKVNVEVNNDILLYFSDIRSHYVYIYEIRS